MDLSGLKQFREEKLIENKNNLGFAKANNLALKEAHGEFVLFLNPDTRVEPGVLDRSVNW